MADAAIAPEKPPTPRQKRQMVRAYFRDALASAEATTVRATAILSSVPDRSDPRQRRRDDANSETLAREMQRQLNDPARFATWWFAHHATKGARDKYRAATAELDKAAGAAAKALRKLLANPSGDHSKAKAAVDAWTKAREAAEAARKEYNALIFEEQEAARNGYVDCSEDAAEWCVQKNHFKCVLVECDYDDCVCTLSVLGGGEWDPKRQRELRERGKGGKHGKDGDKGGGGGKGGHAQAPAAQAGAAAPVQYAEGSQQPPEVPKKPASTKPPPRKKSPEQTPEGATAEGPSACRTCADALALVATMGQATSKARLEQQIDCLWTAAHNSTTASGGRLTDGLDKNVSDRKQLVTDLAARCSSQLSAVGSRQAPGASSAAASENGNGEEIGKDKKKRTPKDGNGRGPQGAAPQFPKGAYFQQAGDDDGTKPDGDKDGGKKAEERPTGTVESPPKDKPPQDTRRTVAGCGTLRRKDFEEIAMRWVPAYGAIMAYGMEGYSYKSWLEINRQFTEAYQMLYAARPDAFKWARLAGFVAGAQVRRGLQTAKGMENNPSIPIIWYPMIPTSSEIKAQLIEGHVAIFRDIFWQHIAFMYCGTRQMAALYAAGEIPWELLVAWTDIADGISRGSSYYVWKGTRALAYYEQKTILQPIIDKNPSVMRYADSWFSSFVDDTVPGRTTNFESDDLADFDERWHWVDSVLLPAFRQYDQRHGSENGHAIPDSIREEIETFPSSAGGR